MDRSDCALIANVFTSDKLGTTSVVENIVDRVLPAYCDGLRRRESNIGE